MLPHRLRYTRGRLLRESFGSNTLDFFYDASGNAYALKYNGTLYYYITNLQRDIMSIVDAQGNVVASYNYDPYGNLIGDNHTEIAIITGSF
jgi:YD repeat-containing protein